MDLKSGKNLKALTVTAENVSNTKATLRFTHPEPSILSKYIIDDACYFILKKTGVYPDYLNNFDEIEFKEATPLTIEPDSSVTCDKSWDHLYGFI